MATRNAARPLPPLEAGVAYRATEFDRFDYFGGVTPGRASILRLCLRNGTTIDLPTTEEKLRHLLFLLVVAFPQDAVENVKKMGWN